MITSPRDHTGQTALHIAAHAGHAACVELLLRGSDPNAIGSGYNPLHLAAMQGSTDCIRVLLAGGACADEAGKDGVMPLYYATFNGHLGAMSALLDGGAAVDRGDVQRSISPLMIACHNSSPRAVSILLERGADAAAVGWNSQLTATHWLTAATEAGATATPRGRTAAQVAQDIFTCLEELVQHGAPLDAGGHFGPPLKVALLTGADAAVTGLLALGCTLPVGGMATDGFKLSARHWADAIARCELLLAALRAGGADAAAARLQQRLLLASADPLAQLRLLQFSAFSPPGESWWDEDEAARPPRYAAVLLDRAARAAALRACAERAESEATARALTALQHWAAARAPRPAAVGAAKRRRTICSDAAASAELDKEVSKAAFAAAVCVGKWVEVAAAARAAQRAEREAAEGVAAAVARLETRAEQLRARTAAGGAAGEHHI